MDSSQISKIYEALDVDKQGFISLEVVQSFIDDFQKNFPDSQQLDNFNSILLKKAHADGHIFMEDFEAAVQELQEMDTLPKSPGAQLTPSDSLELRSSQETLVDPASGSSVTGIGTSWPGGTPRTMHKSPSQLSKDDSNDTHSVSDSGVHDCVTNLDQIIAENEDQSSPATSPRGGHPHRGNSFGGPGTIGNEVTDNEESYEDYGESENDFSLRTADTSGLASTPTALPASDFGRKSPVVNRLLKPPPHPGPSVQNRPDSARGTWPRRRQRSGGDFPRESVNNYAGPWSGQPSAARQAHDLYSSSLNGSPYSSYSEGLCPEVTITQIEEIHEQLAHLSKRCSSLNESQVESTLKHNRLVEENSVLKHQVSSLTDQLKDVESKSTGALYSEKHMMANRRDRYDRERAEELDNLRGRLIGLETDGAEARLEAMKYKTETERLKLEKLRAEEKLSSAEEQVKTLNEERSRYLDIHKRELDCMRKERDHYNHLAEELKRQLEEGRFRTSSANAGNGDGRFNDMYERFKEAQEVVKRLTKENRGIREQLEETQAELMTRTVEQGRSLMQRSEASLAAELDNCTKDELKIDEECSIGDSCPHALERKKLMEILVKEKDANQKLRGYIDNILTRIIEQNPSLLEVCSMES